MSNFIPLFIQGSDKCSRCFKTIHKSLPGIVHCVACSSVQEPHVSTEPKTSEDPVMKKCEERTVAFLEKVTDHPPDESNDVSFFLSITGGHFH